MHSPIHNDTSITLYRLGTAIRIFRDQQELARFLAYNTDHNGYEDPERWECPYADSQNITGRDFLGDVMHGPHCLRIYTFRDARGRTLDIRDHMRLARPLVWQRLHSCPRREILYRDRDAGAILPPRHKAVSQAATPHTAPTLRAMHHVRTERLVSDPEYREFRKPKDLCLKGTWDGGRPGRKSTGWKDRKCARQWQKHEACRKKPLGRAARAKIDRELWQRHEKEGKMEQTLTDMLSAYTEQNENLIESMKGTIQARDAKIARLNGQIAQEERWQSDYRQLLQDVQARGRMLGSARLLCMLAAAADACPGGLTEASLQGLCAQAGIRTQGEILPMYETLCQCRQPLMNWHREIGQAFRAYHDNAQGMDVLSWAPHAPGGETATASITFPVKFRESPRLLKQALEKYASQMPGGE